ncbi:MAG: CusA/CzcA family heavy metal efflux RND transporter [Fibrobacterales bacterium]
MFAFITYLLRNRILVIVALIGILVWGVFSYRSLPTDAFPDISPVMVPVYAEAHGMAPEEVERLITFPIESAMNGLPGVSLVKSTSAFGMAVIYIYFNDDIDIYFARQLVSERLTSAIAELPESDEPPTLGPISTGLGEVFMYYLTIDSTADTENKGALMYLREINDWVVKYQLQTVKGVTEVLSMGGNILQYQVELNPHLMMSLGIGLEDVVETINANNRNAGGQFLVVGSEEYLVRGIGLLENSDDIQNLTVKEVNGVPIRIKDFAEVSFGSEIRRGVVTRNGEEEVVAGIVIKLYGENTSHVIDRLEDKFSAIQKSLPKGVTLVPYYNQKSLVESATSTVVDALWQGGILVLLTLLLFLGNIRTALIVALSLPVCALSAAIVMGVTGMSANLMSLGGVAIAIGMLGDGAIVVIENVHRQLSDSNRSGVSRFEIITVAVSEVARPILFSVAIIIVVFLPLLTLEGVEGKMFAPMALTITFALIGSVVSALVFSPVLASLLLKAVPAQEFILVRVLKRAYRPLLITALRFKKTVVVAAFVAFIGSLATVATIGTEFIPALEEGVLQVNVTMAPSISLEKATETILKMEQIIGKNYGDAISQTLAKIGRPEAGSHPHPVNFANIQMTLKDHDEWQRFETKEDLVMALNGTLSNYPGVQLNFTQPIQNLFDELLSGVRTQLAVKVYGDDLTVLRKKAEEIQEAVEGIPGLVDLAIEQSFGQPQVQIVANRAACSRYGVTVSEILEVVELAIGGETIDQVYVNTRRFGINVRVHEKYRKDPEVIKRLLVHTQNGTVIPLGDVADVVTTIGPIQVNREKNQRRWVIAANVRGRDIGSVVNDMKERIADRVTFDSGYFIEFGGQFENQERAMKRLGIIVPSAFAVIFLMLFLSLKSGKQAVLIFINVPLALIGGILGLILIDEYLSVPASVGFIALFGIAVQNGLVLVTYINQLRTEGVATIDAVITGGLMRIRPVLMTALTTILGLVPLLLATGVGSEVQRPLAAVVVFGLLSSTFLTLFLIPAMYEWFAPKLAIEYTESKESI